MFSISKIKSKKVPGSGSGTSSILRSLIWGPICSFVCSFACSYISGDKTHQRLSLLWLTCWLQNALPVPSGLGAWMLGDGGGDSHTPLSWDLMTLAVLHISLNTPHLRGVWLWCLIGGLLVEFNSGAPRGLYITAYLLIGAVVSRLRGHIAWQARATKKIFYTTGLCAVSAVVTLVHLIGAWSSQFYGNFSLLLGLWVMTLLQAMIIWVYFYAGYPRNQASRLASLPPGPHL